MTSFSPEQEILFLLLKMFYSLFTDFIKISSILASSFLNDRISCLELIKFNTSRTFESKGMSILNRFSLFETTLNFSERSNLFAPIFPSDMYQCVTSNLLYKVEIPLGRKYARNALTKRTLYVHHSYIFRQLLQKVRSQVNAFV